MIDTEQDQVEAKVHTMPPCDFVGEDFVDCAGSDRYDFKTQVGSWANGCTAHYEYYRLYQDLGTGKGQRLVLT